MNVAYNKAFVPKLCAVLAKVNPTVIGITGSYSKTSTKTSRGIPETFAPTFWSPGSINTEMGHSTGDSREAQIRSRFAIVRWAPTESAQSPSCAS
ncbi:MAG: hypothetical protein R3F37_06460 [Candidatus Competibacteraceae bacterium]